MDKELTCFKALSDKNRLRVMMVLTHHDELCACQLTEMLNITGATASRHMSLLLRTGLISSRKDGRWVFYSLTKEGKASPLIKWAKSSLENNAELNQDLEALKGIVNQNPEDLCRKQRLDKCC